MRRAIAPGMKLFPHSVLVSGKEENKKKYRVFFGFFLAVHILIDMNDAQARGGFTLRDQLVQQISDQVLEDHPNYGAVFEKIEAYPLTLDLKSHLTQFTFKQLLFEQMRKRIETSTDYQVLVDQLGFIVKLLQSNYGKTQNALLLDLLNRSFTQLIQRFAQREPGQIVDQEDVPGGIQNVEMTNHEKLRVLRLRDFVKDHKESPLPYLNPSNLVLLRESIESAAPEVKSILFYEFFSTIHMRAREQILSDGTYRSKPKYLKLSSEWIAHAMDLLSTIPQEEQLSLSTIISALWACEGLTAQQESMLMSMSEGLGDLEARFKVQKFILAFHPKANRDAIIDDVLGTLGSLGEPSLRLARVEKLLGTSFSLSREQFQKIYSAINSNAYKTPELSYLWKSIICHLMLRFSNDFDERIQDLILTFIPRVETNSHFVRESLLRKVLQQSAEPRWVYKKIMAKYGRVFQGLQLRRKAPSFDSFSEVLKHPDGHETEILNFLKGQTDLSYYSLPVDRLSRVQYLQIYPKIVKYLVNHPDFAVSSAVLTAAHYEKAKSIQILKEVFSQYAVSMYDQERLLNLAQNNEVDAKIAFGRMLALIHVSPDVDVKHQNMAVSWIEENFLSLALDATVIAMNPSLTPKNQERLFQVLYEKRFRKSHVNYSKWMEERGKVYLALLRNPSLDSRLKIRLLQAITESTELQTSLNALVSLN